MARIDITKHRKGEFMHALDQAQPGDELVYHIGDHAAGAHKRDAMDASDAGLCLLYQRRYGEQFIYIARKPKK